jgi:hypothetical protein
MASVLENGHAARFACTLHRVKSPFKTYVARPRSARSPRQQERLAAQSGDYRRRLIGFYVTGFWCGDTSGENEFCEPGRRRWSSPKPRRSFAQSIRSLHISPTIRGITVEKESYRPMPIVVVGLGANVFLTVSATLLKMSMKRASCSPRSFCSSRAFGRLPALAGLHCGGIVAHIISFVFGSSVSCLKIPHRASGWSRPTPGLSRRASSRATAKLTIKDPLIRHRPRPQVRHRPSATLAECGSYSG